MAGCPCRIWTRTRMLRLTKQVRQHKPATTEPSKFDARRPVEGFSRALVCLNQCESWRPATSSPVAGISGTPRDMEHHFAVVFKRIAILCLCSWGSQGCSSYLVKESSPKIGFLLRSFSINSGLLHKSPLTTCANVG